MMGEGLLLEGETTMECSGSATANVVSSKKPQQILVTNTV